MSQEINIIDVRSVVEGPPHDAAKLLHTFFNPRRGVLGRALPSRMCLARAGVQGFCGVCIAKCYQIWDHNAIPHAGQVSAERRHHPFLCSEWTIERSWDK